MREKLNNLLIKLEQEGQKGRESSKSHLKAALYDWNVESQWDSDRAVILDYEDKGYAFITFTKKEPRHCSLRHIFVLEEHRGKGVGQWLVDRIIFEMEKRQCDILRFFADKPSVKFYERLGFKWHGVSKTGLPFYYGDSRGNLLKLPKSQERYIVDKKEL